MRKTLRRVVSRLTTPLWKPTVAGICLGAVIGGLALSAGTTREASALIRIYPPVDVMQTMTASSPSPDPQQSYISGEITYLNSPGFADEVAKELNQTDPPQLSATQDAQSSIVTFSATDSNASDAVRIVNAALQVYKDHAQQLIRARGMDAINGINAILARAQVPEPAPAPGDQTPRTDRQTPTDQLQAQLYWIEVQTQRLTPFQVVSPPTETNTGGVPKWQLGVVGGGLLGGLVFLGAALAWRRRVGLVTSPSVLDPVVARVVVPTVALGRLSPGTPAYTALARTLNNQLSASRAGTILVVGASAESGTSDVAALIAAAGKEHSDVRLVDLLGSPDSVESFREGLASGTTSVIDGGSIDASSVLPQAADVAGQVVVVARIGSDVIDEVGTAALLGTDRDLPVCAVCTTGSSQRERKTKHRIPLQTKRTRRSSAVSTGDEQADKTERLSIPSK